jgi:hypothetical protein
MVGASVWPWRVRDRLGSSAAGCSVRSASCSMVTATRLRPETRRAGARCSARSGIGVACPAGHGHQAGMAWLRRRGRGGESASGGGRWEQDEGDGSSGFYSAAPRFPGEGEGAMGGGDRRCARSRTRGHHPWHGQLRRAREASGGLQKGRGTGLGAVKASRLPALGFIRARQLCRRTTEAAS